MAIGKAGLSDDAGGDDGVPERLKIRDEADLKSKLQEGADSPARVLRAADWQEKRRQLAARHRMA